MFRYVALFHDYHGTFTLFGAYQNETKIKAGLQLVFLISSVVIISCYEWISLNSIIYFFI